MSVWFNRQCLVRQSQAQATHVQPMNFDSVAWTARAEPLLDTLVLQRAAHRYGLSLHWDRILARMTFNPGRRRRISHLVSQSIVIPTYNECENIGPLVHGILGLGLDAQVIIVDDNSPDGTGRLADGLSAQNASVFVVHRPGKLGLGTAHIAGMKAALAGDAGQIVTMDADFSHHPRYLPDLLAALDQFDMVIGSRYVSGGDTLNCTLPRKALSRGANLFARTVLSLEVEDATAGFRGYRRAVLESIPLDDIVSDGYSFLVEMLYHCQRNGWNIGEVAIVFENRQRGSSKISKTEILKAMQTVGRLGWERLRS
ncbi:polyprenol monophosphomannose synthase [Chloroflexota bacterium]